MKPTRDQIREWLSEDKKRRTWLVKECGTTSKTLSNWLSGQDIPDATHKLIGKLLSETERQRSNGENPPDVPAGYSAIFLSGERLARADQASRKVGADSLADFCLEAIKVRADEILGEVKSGKGLESLPSPRKNGKAG